MHLFRIRKDFCDLFLLFLVFLIVITANHIPNGKKTVTSTQANESIWLAQKADTLSTHSVEQGTENLSWVDNSAFNGSLLKARR